MESGNEKNISTEQDKKEQKIRIQEKDEYKGRQKHHKAQEKKRKEASDCSWRGMNFFRQIGWSQKK